MAEIRDPSERPEASAAFPLTLALPTPGDLLASRYEVIRELGRGGMGVVYQVEDRHLQEQLALKLMVTLGGEATDAHRRFQVEAKLARKITHRSVCRVYEYGLDAQRPYLCMELVDGVDLRTRIATAGPYSAKEAAAIGLQLAEGLAAIHDNGVLHRDLKTRNVMLDSAGNVRIMDFGIAKALESEVAGLTRAGYVVGTPEFMSPEQIRGRPLDRRSDLYSLGIVLYEVLSGQTPFRADAKRACIEKQLADPPDFDVGPKGGIPGDWRPLLASLLAKEPRDRPGSAHVVAERLRAMLAPPAPATTLLVRGPRSTRWAWMAIGVVLAAAALIVRFRPPPPQADPIGRWVPPARVPSATVASPSLPAALQPEAATAMATPMPGRSAATRPAPNPPRPSPPRASPEAAVQRESSDQPREVVERSRIDRPRIGTAIEVTVTSPLRIAQARPGDPFEGELADDLRSAGGALWASAGVRVKGVVSRVHRGPAASLSLSLRAIDGRRITTSDLNIVQAQLESDPSLAAALVGGLGGAAVGAAIDGAEGARKGAILGASAAVAADSRQISESDGRIAIGPRLRFSLISVIDASEPMGGTVEASR